MRKFYYVPFVAIFRERKNMYTLSQKSVEQRGVDKKTGAVNVLLSLKNIVSSD